LQRAVPLALILFVGLQNALKTKIHAFAWILSVPPNWRATSCRGNMVSGKYNIDRVTLAFITKLSSQVAAE